MAEQVLGIIDDLESDSTFNMGQIYTIYFTTERLIVAKTMGGLKRFAIRQSTAMGVEKMISKKLAEKRAIQLAELRPDDIVAADKHNFTIKYGDLQAIELKKPHFMKAGKVKIISGDEEYRYKLMEKNDFEECDETIRSAVHEKLAVV